MQIPSTNRNLKIVDSSLVFYQPLVVSFNSTKSVENALGSTSLTPDVWPKFGITFDGSIDRGGASVLTSCRTLSSLIRNTKFGPNIASQTRQSTARRS